MSRPVNNDNKVVRLSKKNNAPQITSNVKNINIGVVIVALVFIYLLIYIISGLKKEHLSIYEVQAISMSKNCSAEGVIIRNENNYYTNTAGYTNYYVRNGSRVAVGDTIYSIDESKKVYDYLNENGITYKINDDDIEDLKKYIFEFNEKYNSNNFELVYDLKNELYSEITNIADSYLLNNLNLIVDSSNNLNFNIFKAEQSGTVSFFNDSLNGLTIENVSPKTFDKTDYKSNTLYEAEIKENNSLVYKIIDDEAWTIVIKLTKEQYDELSGNSTLKFKIKNDGLQLSKPCTFFMKDGGYFARVDLTEYMIRYIKFRFIDIELDLSSEEGLKIPYSSITTKDFYMIPSAYYIYNEEADADGFTLMEYNIETKETHYKFIPCDIYYEDEEKGVVYVDQKTFDYGQYIYSMSEETLYQVSVVGSLEGVYNVNKGYAVFRRIDIISKNEDYCIVKGGSKRGLNAHDHIVLHSELINENVQIY